MTAITSTRSAAAGDQRVVLHGVSWETYQDLLHADESARGAVRMTYDRGRLVLMSPSRAHEIAAERLGQIIRSTTIGLGLNCQGVGRTTLTREDSLRGKEPDTAFHIASEPRVRGKRGERLDLDVDPPPDLAVEVEITHRDPSMLDVYAALGVPEVWLFDGRSLRCLVLSEAGNYEDVTTSPALPSLRLDEIPGWLERADAEGETATFTAFLDRVRGEPGPATRPATGPAEGRD
jgi:Uma2 family endonuclease